MDIERRRRRYRQYYSANKAEINKKRRQARVGRPEIFSLTNIHTQTPTNKMHSVSIDYSFVLHDFLYPEEKKMKVDASSNVNTIEHITTKEESVSQSESYNMQCCEKQCSWLFNSPFNSDSSFSDIGTQTMEKPLSEHFERQSTVHISNNSANSYSDIDVNNYKTPTEVTHTNFKSPIIEAEQASELKNIDDYHIIIRSDPGLDQRTYNKPSSAEVAGIWTENETDEAVLSQSWDIRAHTKSGSSHKVQYYYACYDPLQYVLMFPNGKPGWHGNIPRVGCSTKKLKTQKDICQYNSFEEILETEKEGASTSKHGESMIDDIHNSGHVSKRKRTTVSCREYYLYKL
ncbi:hypothetical protein LIER_27273 [Lithospermum erythrorhizon]|uniref:Uncharacterized protein n=1 Tax=Lithospermum erythrorhizon TaxID=34254 RepID=A0AAV3RHB9_LITER